MLKHQRQRATTAAARWRYPRLHLKGPSDPTLIEPPLPICAKQVALWAFFTRLILPLHQLVSTYEDNAFLHEHGRIKYLNIKVE